MCNSSPRISLPRFAVLHIARSASPSHHRRPSLEKSIRTNRALSISPLKGRSVGWRGGTAANMGIRSRPRFTHVFQNISMRAVGCRFLGLTRFCGAFTDPHRPSWSPPKPSKMPSQRADLRIFSGGPGVLTPTFFAHAPKIF